MCHGQKVSHGPRGFCVYAIGSFRVVDTHRTTNLVNLHRDLAEMNQELIKLTIQLLQKFI